MKNKIIKNAFIFVTGDVLSKIIPFILLPIVTNYLTASEFGVYSLYATFLEFAAILITFSGGAYFSYYYLRSENTLEKQDSISTPVIVMFIHALALFVLLSSAMSFVQIESIKREYVVLIPIVALLMSLMNYHLLVEQIQEKALVVSVVRVLYSLISSLSIVALLVLGFGLDGRVYAGVISYGLVLLVSWKLLYKDVKLKNSFRQGVKKFYLYSFKYLPVSLSWWVKSGVDKVLIGTFLSSKLLGSFSLAFQLSSVILVITSAIGSAITPHIFRLYNAGEYYKLKVILISSFFTVIISSAIYFLALNLSFDVIFNESYASALDMIPYVLLGLMFQGVFILINPFLMAADQRDFLMLCGVISTVLHVALSFVLINLLGIEGIILSGVFSYGCMVVIAVYKIHYILKEGDVDYNAS